MNSLSKKLGRIFTASAFAEAGEYDMAREILREEERPQKHYRISLTPRPRKVLRAPGIKR
jgi:hypothetical protein